MIVVDTSVLVYAVGESHRLREPCRQLFRAIGERRVDVTTTVEVIQEFAHVRARRRSRQDAARYGRDYASLLSPLLRSTTSDLATGLDLFEQHPRLGAFDALLAATAMSNNAEALVSEDDAFSTVLGLTHIRPGTADFGRLIEV